MDFFKSVFADEDQQDEQSPSSELEPEPETQPTWGFVGGLLKTFATKSESVLETYRKDLDEFTAGLKNETQVLKHVATSSLEVGASKAQVSLESVGQAFDSFGSVVAHIITHGGNTNNNTDGSDLDPDLGSSNSPVMEKGKYSRFEVQLRGIQSDTGTFMEDPEDIGEFEKWKLGFNLGEKRDEIEGLIRDNVVLKGIYERIVPNLVDYDVFWCRYFFRVFKVEQAESVRAKLVERANEDEDLSWDVDDDDEGEDVGKGEGEDEIGNVGDEEEKKVVNDEGESRNSPSSLNNEGKEVKGGGEKVECESSINEEEVKGDDGVEEKVGSEVSKDSDISVVSTQPSFRGEEEEDMGWDEIEDIGSDEDEDGKKGKQSGGVSSPSNREELRKQLSVAEDDEDLSWDIEDDDEPLKKS